MKFFGIDEVKNLHHDEGIEDESKMPRKYSVLLINVSIVIIPVDMFESSTSYSSTDDSIFPFIFRMSSEIVVS